MHYPIKEKATFKDGVKVKEEPIKPKYDKVKIEEPKKKK